MGSQSRTTFAVAEDGVDPDMVPQRVLHTGAGMPGIGLGTFSMDDFERVLRHTIITNG